MNTYLDATLMEKDDAIALFQSYSLNDLRARLVWVSAFFEVEHKIHDYVAGLVNDLYDNDYQLYSGELEIQPLKGDVLHQRVYLWSRMQDIDYGASYREHRLSLHDTVVSDEDVPSLIAQGVAIRKAYENGFKDRSKEVQTALAGLMGVDLQQLADDD